MSHLGVSEVWSVAEVWRVRAAIILLGDSSWRDLRAPMVATEVSVVPTDISLEIAESIAVDVNAAYDDGEEG